MGDGIVEEWLRPLSLQHYMQAFLDNGYDDLEVCKQIGEPDLDAIGVLNPSHRKSILDAVEVLRKEGESAVYFTLENPDYASYASGQVRSGAEVRAVGRQCDLQSCLLGKSQFSYPRLQLTALLRERLLRDDVHLGELPYTDQNGKLDVETMQHLALHYADQLNVPSKDVLDRLEELRMTALHPDGCHSSEAEVVEPVSPGPGLYSMISVYGQSPRSAPLPIPPLSSPHKTETSGGANSNCNRHQRVLCPRRRMMTSCLYVDPIELDQNIEDIGSPKRIPRSSLTHSASTDPSNAGSDNGGGASELSVKESVGNTLGRLFRSVTLRRPPKKYTYHQHEGDLNASEMMMPEDERIQLMILVKEGRLSIDEAVEMVKNHRCECEHQPMEEVNFVQHDDTSSVPLSSSCPIGCPIETSSAYRDIRPKVAFGSPISRWRGGGTAKELEKHTRCFIPLLRGKKSEAFDPNISPRSKFFGWSPPLPPVPRNSGIIVESLSAECMARYKSSSLNCSPLLTSKSGDVQPTLPVRKSRSLHSSVPPQMTTGCSYEGSRDSMLQMLPHHYENIRQSDGQRLLSTMDISQNGISFDTKRQIEAGEDWEHEKHNPNRTLTNAGQKIRDKTAAASVQNLNKNEGVGLKEQNNHKSRARRRQLKDKEEPVMSSTDSLTNAIASGICGVSSSSSHSSVSTEEEQIPKLASVNRVRAKVDYIPGTGDDPEALTLKKGDVIYLLGMLDSPWCRGILNNQIGKFRFTDVEPVNEEGVHLMTPRHMRPCKGRRHQRKPKPKTVEELLQRLGLQHLAHVFLHHGFHTLDDFSELDEVDLNELKITNPEERVKLITAAQLLLDTEQNEFSSCSRSASQSPALSHDASSQTVLTHFSARERSVAAPVGLTGRPPSMTQTSNGYSDDQEILSITGNGTVVLSWGENNAATFDASSSGARTVAPYNGVSLSDPSINSSRDTAESCHHCAEDISSANSMSFKCSSTSTQSGLKLLEGSRKHCTSETQTQTMRCPNVSLLQQVPMETEESDENDFKKREIELGRNGPRKITSGGITIPSKNCVLDTIHRKSPSDVLASSPFLINSSALVATRVGAASSIKTAHVRQLVTSSPLHSFWPQISRLGCQDSNSTDMSLLIVDEDGGPGHDQGLSDTASEQKVLLPLQDLLTKLRLSDYITKFTCCGVTTSEHLKRLDEVKLRAIGITNEHHIQLLVKTIESLKHGAKVLAIHELRVSSDGSLEGQDLENAAEIRADPSFSVSNNIQNSRIVSKLSSDNNRASFKTRTTTQRHSKIIDKV